MQISALPDIRALLRSDGGNINPLHLPAGWLVPLLYLLASPLSGKKKTVRGGGAPRTPTGQQDGTLRLYEKYLKLFYGRTNSFG